jgi:sensor histidine kinase YesM
LKLTISLLILFFSTALFSSFFEDISDSLSISTYNTISSYKDLSRLDYRDVDEFELDEKDSLILKIDIPKFDDRELYLFHSAYGGDFNVIYNNSLIYSYSEGEKFNHFIPLETHYDHLYIIYKNSSTDPIYYRDLFLMDNIFLLEEYSSSKSNLLFEIYITKQYFFLFIAIISIFFYFYAPKQFRKSFIALVLYSTILWLDAFLDPKRFAELGIYFEVYYKAVLIVKLLFVFVVSYITQKLILGDRSKIVSYLIRILVVSIVLQTIFVLLFDQGGILFLVDFLIIFGSLIIAAIALIGNRSIVKSKVIFYVTLLFILLPFLELFDYHTASFIFEIGNHIVSLIVLLLFYNSFFDSYKVLKAQEVEYLKNIERSERDILILEQEKLEAQLLVFRNQLNPHFIFNTLSTITGLVYEDREKAIRYIEELSTVYRYLINSTEKELISIDRELEFLDSYIYLLKIRFDETLIITIDSDGSRGELPPLTIQLFMENVIKHNIINKLNKMDIKIEIVEGEIIFTNRYNPKQIKDLDRSFGVGYNNINKMLKIYGGEPLESMIKDNRYIVKCRLIRRSR